MRLPSLTFPLLAAMATFVVGSNAQADICGRSPELRDSLAFQLRKPCAEIGPADLAKIKKLALPMTFRAPHNRHPGPPREVHIKSLKWGDLEGLVNMEEFILLDSVPAIPPDLFEGLASLRRVVISAAGSSSVPEELFHAVPELTSIAISLNIEIPERLFAKSGKLQNLEVSGSCQTRPSSGVFAALTQLKTLNLVCYSLEEIPQGLLTPVVGSLEKLTVGFPKLKVLPADLLRGAKNLKQFLLTGTQVKTLPSRFFADTALNDTLNLSGNQLEAIEEGAFEGLDKVSWLILTKNKLKTLPARPFVDMRSLSALYLDENELTHLPENTLDGLGKLWSIRLGKNKLEEFPRGFGAGASILITIEAEENRISRLTPEAMRGLVKLTSLRLSKNALTALDPAALKEMPILMSLGVDESPLRQLPERLLAGNPLMSDFSASRTLLKSVPADLLAYSKMQLLSLAENDLKTFPQGFFSSQPELRGIYLQRNRLTKAEIDRIMDERGDPKAFRVEDQRRFED